MLKTLRQIIVESLWQTYRLNTPQMQQIEKSLNQIGPKKLFLDHFAIIDLPGPYTGIGPLKGLFHSLGFMEQGHDYLPDKQNDFLWMCERDAMHLPAKEVLPQVVVADFRLDALPIEIRKVIEKYSQQACSTSLQTIQHLLKNVLNNSGERTQQLRQTILSYFSGRDWPLPTISEFSLVHEFNELLAWVLVFGRRPNHFTLSVHLLDIFPDLTAFNHFIESQVGLALNQEGGIIKGGAQTGIAQGSTLGISQTLELADGSIQIPTGFVEFVYRYPRSSFLATHSPGRVSTPLPNLWKDYFTGFIAKHADDVIESLFTRLNPI